MKNFPQPDATHVRPCGPPRIPAGCGRAADELIGSVHVITDESDPDPQRRYKTVYNPHNGKTWRMRTAASADGSRWKAAEDFDIDQFLEASSFYKFNAQRDEIVHRFRVRADVYRWMADGLGTSTP